MAQGEAEKLAIDLLRRVGLEDKRDDYPERFQADSNSVPQLHARSRCIREVMLFDEVTSHSIPNLSAKFCARCASSPSRA